MDALIINDIGKVQNSFDSAEDYRQIKEKPSCIEIYDAFADALLGIEAYEYIDVVFYFHKSESKLQTTTLNHPDVLRGAFATRSPKRPNLIGVTSVKLLERNGNTLIVEGLDALNNTPVLDIKSTDTSLFAQISDNNPAHKSKLRNSPRIDIRNDIHALRTDNLMIKAAALHGHYCPGLALGIMAACHAMNALEAESDGMEDLLAITETNNCFSDGVQFVTGCTFGNNALIFKDIGKTAFTLTHRNGKGIRVSSKPDSKKVIRESFPDYNNLYAQVVAAQNHTPELVAAYQKSALDRAFGTLSLPFDRLFKVQQIDVDVPAYAPVYDSLLCIACGESVMQNRTARVDGKTLCLPCAGKQSGLLTGYGIK
ncbi:MAG: TrmO family methyltransferase [Bacteroidales bacterium]|nr:TrmO family methyltransferase [Bacteroidales bacterium]